MSSATSATIPMSAAGAADPTRAKGPTGSAAGGAAAGASAHTIQELSSPLQVIGVQQSSPVAWRSDGKALAYVSGNHSIFILKPDSSGSMIVDCVLNGHDSHVRALLFHPSNNDTLVSGGVDGIFVWSLRERRAVREIRSEANVSPEFPAHESDVEVLAFAFGNTLVSGSKDSNIKLWDADRGYVLLETMTGHKAAVLCLKVHSKTQRLASAGRDSSIKVWDISTLAPEWRARRMDDRGIKCPLLGNLDGHRGDVVALTWRPDGQTMYSGARDNTWRLWNVTKFVEVRIIEDSSRGMDGSHKGDVRRVIGLPGDQFALTAAMDGTAMLWKIDPEDGTDSLTAAVEAAAGSGSGTGEGESKADDAAAGASAAGAPDDAATSVSGGGGGAGWDAGTAAILEQIMGGDLPAEGAVSLAVDVPAEDKILGSIQLFPFEAGVFCMELCPANMRIAVSSSANTVAIYQFDPRPAMLLGYDPLDPRVDDSSRTGRVSLPQVQVFHGHSDAVHEIVTLGDSEDRLVATCAADNKVAVYDAATTNRIAALDFTASALCLAVARTPEAGAVLLAGGTDYVIRAYSGDPGRHISRAKQLYEESVRSGHHGVTSPEDFELARFEGHSGRVQTLAVNASSTLMVSGAHDFCILLWDLSKVKLTAPAPGVAREAGVPRVAPVGRVDAHMGHVTSLCFCEASVSGGNLLASGGNDHAVKVWNVTKSALGGSTLTLKWSGQDTGDESRFSAGSKEGTSSLARSGPAPHRSSVSAVQWGRGPSSGLLFSAAWDHSTCVWAADSSRGEAVVPLASRSLHGARITDMDISADGMYLVTVSADFSARQWTATRDLRPVARFPCTALDGGMTSVAVGRRQFFTASENGQIRVFPLFNPADPSVSKTFRAVVDEAQEAEGQGAESVVLSTEANAAAASSAAAGAHAFVSSNPIGPVAKPLLPPSAEH